MTQCDEVTREQIEAELCVAVQSAGLQVCNTAAIIGQSVNAIVSAYTVKLVEEIGKCKSMHEVEQMLGMISVGPVGVRTPAECE